MISPTVPVTEPLQKTFLLGVGAQKAGTSWMHNQLNRMPYSDFGFSKEYHVFDALWVPECRYLRDETVQIAKKALLSKAYKNSGLGEVLKRKQLWKRMSFLSDIDSYFDYFDGLSKKHEGDYFLTGDITPSYSGLKSDDLLKIRSGLEKRGFDIKVLFILRDPVERCISAVRMARRNHFDSISKDKSNPRRRKAEEAFEDEQTSVMKQFKTPEQEIRTRYDQTIDHLSAAFDPDQIHYALYENLFSEAEIDKISKWLRLPAFKANFGKQVNVSKTDNHISDPAREEMAKYYEPAYMAAIGIFGADEIARLWPSYRFVQTAPDA